MSTDLRERAHDALRAELIERAADLLVEGDAERMTADELARGLGISRATFFRYLGSKDEVLAAAVLGDDDWFADAWTGATDAPCTWQRLRAALEPAVQQAEHSGSVLRARIRLVRDRPGVAGRLRRARTPQITALIDAMADDGWTRTAASPLAVAAIAVLDQCRADWAQDATTSLRTMLDRAFTELQLAGRGIGGSTGRAG